MPVFVEQKVQEVDSNPRRSQTKTVAVQVNLIA